jgi:hypothetical protein
MEPLGRILSKRVSQTALPPEDQARLIWRDAVGKYIASQTQPTHFVRTRLIVDVPDFTWKKQLHAMHGMILTRMRERLGPGAITDLEFRVAPPRIQPRADAPAKPSRPLPLFDGVLAAPVQPADEADGIGDPVFRRLYLISRARHRRAS